MFNDDLSADLETVQQGIDAILALPPEDQELLRGDLEHLRNLKRELEARQ